MDGLTDLEKYLLECIEDGMIVFKPDGDGEGPLRRFQRTVKTLMALRDAGYITMAEPHPNTYFAEDYYDLVFDCRLV